MQDPVRRVFESSLALAVQLACAASAGAASASADQQAVDAVAGESRQAREACFPGPSDDWERRRPAEAWMDSAALSAAVDFAVRNESPFGHDLRAYLEDRLLTTGPHGEIVGPMKDRGDPNGLIRDLEDPVVDYLRPGEGRELFEPSRNTSITWHHLFTQTSEWEGTLWEKPDALEGR